MTYQDMAAKIAEKAKKKGYDENLFFVATFSDYQRIRKHLQVIAKKIDEKGIVIGDSVNPLVNEYSRTAQSASALAEKLLKMIGENVKEVKGAKDDNGESVSEQKECPDFSMLSPAKLKYWCKHYDIDPSDYSKGYLFKALEKRWKFEYED